MNGFEEKLKMVLTIYEKTGSLEETIKQCNLTEEQTKKLRETFKYLDKIEENVRSLEAAKAEGMSREAWLTDKVIESAERNNLSPKEAEKLANELAKSTAKELDKRMKEA